MLYGVGLRQGLGTLDLGSDWSPSTDKIRRRRPKRQPFSTLHSRASNRILRMRSIVPCIIASWSLYPTSSCNRASTFWILMAIVSCHNISMTAVLHGVFDSHATFLFEKLLPNDSGSCCCWAQSFLSRRNIGNGIRNEFSHTWITFQLQRLLMTWRTSCNIMPTIII